MKQKKAPKFIIDILQEERGKTPEKEKQMIL